LITKEYNFRKNNVRVTLHGGWFKVHLDGKEFYAKYGFNIESTPDHHIDLMMYYLFYGFGENKTALVKKEKFDFHTGDSIVSSGYAEVEIPYYEKEGITIDDPSFFKESVFDSCGNKSVTMFSGGYDSTALHILFPESHLVHLHRDYDVDYGQNQMRAVKEAKAHIVNNNMELIRKHYVGRHGFNHGQGYASLLIPFLSRFKAKDIYCGVVFDDLFFGYPRGKDLTFGAQYNYSRTYNAARWASRCGVNISMPICGVSERITTMLVEGTKFKDISSSCHTLISGNKCGKCFKCFRKLPMAGTPELVQAEAFKRVKKIISDKPLKMACSTVYGIQSLAPKSLEFRPYMELNVSFTGRYNEWIMDLFCDAETAQKSKSRLDEFGFKKMTPNDSELISNFVDSVNKIQS